MSVFEHTLPLEMAKKDPNIHTLFRVKYRDLKWNQKQ